MLSEEELLALALEVRTQAYAPWSRFQVGAVVEGASGRVFTGCNVENESFPLCCCAERVAVYKAVSEGERQIVRVLVVTEADPPAAPCGGCRQVLHTFGANAEVLIASPRGIHRRTTVRALLPDGFEADQLRTGQR